MIYNCTTKREECKEKSVVFGYKFEFFIKKMENSIAFFLVLMYNNIS